MNYPLIIHKATFEVVSERSLNSKTFLNPDGSFTTRFHGGHIHYQHPLTNELEEIDTSLEEVNDGWIQKQASYYSKFPKYANDWIEFEDMFEGKQHVIKLRPVAAKQAGYVVIDEEDPWKDKKVIYPEAFGPTMDLELIAGNIVFNKLIKIHQLPKDHQGDLELLFEMQIPDDFVFMTNGKEWDFKEPIRYRDNVSILPKGETDLEKGTFLRQFRAWEDRTVGGRKVINIEVEFFKQDGKLYFKKILPEPFLKTAQFPIYTDQSSTFYSSTNDGTIEADGAGCPNTWDGAHDDTTGGSVDTSTGTFGLEVVSSLQFIPGSCYVIKRSFVMFDTSSLDDSATITATTLDLYLDATGNDDNDGDDFVVVVQSFAGSSLAVADVDDCGDAINNPTEGSGRIDVTGMSSGAYETFTLNATGRGWVSLTGDTDLCMREGHDVIDSEIIVSFGVEALFTGADFAGTTRDPFLTVTYTVSGPLRGAIMLID